MEARITALTETNFNSLQIEKLIKLQQSLLSLDPEN